MPHPRHRVIGYRNGKTSCAFRDWLRRHGEGRRVLCFTFWLEHVTDGPCRDDSDRLGARNPGALHGTGTRAASLHNLLRGSGRYWGTPGKGARSWGEGSGAEGGHSELRQLRVVRRPGGEFIGLWTPADTPANPPA